MIRFIDLFAGIGGFHLAFSKLGCECVFASEIDEHARKTYLANFKDVKKMDREGLFNKDIKKIVPSEIPDFDILCAGFPCQPFSQAGKKKGFDDVYGGERGNLFFYIADIIQEKQPQAFFLENVKGLISHDNGNTLKVIKDILENELGYSFYLKVVKACDYGLPQLRPRAFIVGFRDDYLKDFDFPEKKDLLFTMSDVFNGKCTRDIGYTLRVGGRGSKIDDRRNWEFYHVDNDVKRVTTTEAKKMQGYPDDFIFPVSETQSMKQLGNTVAVNAVREVGVNIIKYLEQLRVGKNIMVKNKGKNKGEWTEFFTLIKLMNKKEIYLSDSDLDAKDESLKVTSITTRNLDRKFNLLEDGCIRIVDNENKEISTENISNYINAEKLSYLKDVIINSKGSSFYIDDFMVIKDKLGISFIKGGNSNNKSDIVLDFIYQNDRYIDNGFGIKSYLGSKPTLLNASGNTNFLFEVKGINKKDIENINNINTRTKLKDRIEKIYELGGNLSFLKAEKETMNYNLKMIDSYMPNIVGEMLLSHYKDRCSSIKDIVTKIFLNKNNSIECCADDITMLEDKVKRLLIAILLGFFAGTKWDGKFLSKGTLVVKSCGDILAFHIIDIESLKDYLYKNIRFDTPSSTRHKFGHIVEDGKNVYMKLNMQLRF
ncbi:modification methylase HhaI domain protein (plasmid) [Francisella philomiragia]|uniref:HpaII family restriction endonuclease n=1 Tax=Francisella philomiragia TaxID=28110 RepID=UPI0005A5724B|nr:HpaII family restriction endonuclease [Francisella philomiragia]AJI58119.1 modification methylase HhaI domain protein [Francisella philomiragia]